MDFLASLWEIAGHNPAIIFASGVIFTRLVEYMFNKYENRRKLQIRTRIGHRTDAHGGKSFELLVKNTGNVPLGLHYYGYRTWNGGGIDQQHPSIYSGGTILEPERAEEELHFYDGVRGAHLLVPQDEVYYYFVETGIKVFRLYTRFFLCAWLKRLMIYLRNAGTRKVLPPPR